MTYNNSQNNAGNSAKPSTSTIIRNLFSDQSCLRLSYWNDMLSVRYYPCLGTGSNGLYQYDYSKKTGTAITMDKCLALAATIREKFLPAIEAVAKGTPLTPMSVAMPVGTNGNLVCLEYKADKDGKPSLFFNIHTGVGTDGSAPIDGTVTYKFNKTSVMEDYNPSNGAHTPVEVESEFLYFYSLLKTIEDIGPASAHGAANANVFKSGGNSNGNNGGGKSYGNNTGNGGNAYQNQYQQPTSAPAAYTAPTGAFDPSLLPY